MEKLNANHTSERLRNRDYLNNLKENLKRKFKSARSSKGNDKVAVLVITHNGKKYLAECLRPLMDQSYKYFEIYLVDNASTDGSSEFVRKNFPNVKIIRFMKNYGFAKGYLAPLVILVGTLIEEVASIFYPLYQAYERLIYPRENLRDLLAWHLRLPELAIVLTYPIFGYIFGVLCPIPEFIRQSFFVFGLVWMTMVLYIAKFFPGIIPEKEVEHLTSTGDTFKWLKLYVIAHVIFMLAWSLTPTLSLVYLSLIHI